VNGLRSKWNEAKTHLSEFDVTIFTETKIDANVTNGSLHLPGFTINRRDRNSHGGGVCSYIRDTLKPVCLNDVQDKYATRGLEVTVDKVVLGRRSTKLLFIGVYRPPNSGVGWFDIFNDLILEVTLFGSLCILGDLNADLLDANSRTSRLLKASLKLAGSNVKSLNPTRITTNSATCLDIIAIPADIDCLQYEVGVRSASDHFPVEASISIGCSNKLSPLKKRSFKSIDFDLTKALISNIVLPAVDVQIGCDSPNLLLDSWHNSMSEVLDQVAPIKSFPAASKKRSGFLNKDIRELMARRDCSARKVHKDPSNVAHLIELKTLKKQVKSRLRKALKVRGEQLLKDNSKSAWRFIRESTFTTKKDPRPSVDPVALNKFFAQMVQAPSAAPLLTPSLCNASNDFVLFPLTISQVEHMLASIRSDTATGPDGLPAFFLKSIASSIAPNITTIVNASFTQGVFPNLWKRANVVAIWKGKGAKAEPSSYRPISILPVLARVVEKQVAAQLLTHCDRNQIIPPQQFGFRPKSSCELALLHALEGWMGAVDKGEMVGALLIDLSKAFDSISHQKLIIELSLIGCGLGALDWFASYLSNRLQRVSDLSQSTDWKLVSRGVPQGSCLSPLLFNIFVRNLPAACHANVVQFADDLTNSCSGSNIVDIGSDLAQSFQLTKSFCESLDLVINTDKTQFIVFKSVGRKIPEDFVIKIDDCSLKPATSVKLLGVTLDRHFTFGDHFDKITSKCRGLLGVLNRATPYLSRDLLRLAYISLIRSHLEYCSAIFSTASNTQLLKLDVIQKMAARVISGVPRNAHSAPLLANLKLEPLSDRRSNHAISLAKSFLSGECHPALKEMFRSTLDGRIDNDISSRIRIGNRRFSEFAKTSFNNRLET
jgi:Reverse transcriptase (RNA-dependent DNA polymerase)